MIGILAALVVFMSPVAPSKKVLTFNTPDTIIVVLSACPPVCVSRTAQKALKNVMAIHFRPQTQRPGDRF